MDQVLGTVMAKEIDEITSVVASRLSHPPTTCSALDKIAKSRSIYTIARGSSDAVACVLSYEFMRVLGIPVTSLPPSIFSLHHGVEMQNMGVLVISQSGASDDLVRSAATAKTRGATVIGITNQPNSKVEAEADATIAINAGPEIAVPATKTVVGGIAAGMALLSQIKPSYKSDTEKTVTAFQKWNGQSHPQAAQIIAGLLRAQNVYVIGRGAGLGAAQEIALKLKECCALHAEAYSSSEVLHGPLQLVTKPLTILLIDTGEAETQDSLNAAHTRFKEAGSTVYRVSPADFGVLEIAPAGGAALAIAMLYSIVRSVAVSLGMDPDAPNTLSKVTVTR